LLATQLTRGVVRRAATWCAAIRDWLEVAALAEVLVTIVAAMPSESIAQ
jgi:hypothetical protein